MFMATLHFIKNESMGDSIIRKMYCKRFQQILINQILFVKFPKEWALTNLRIIRIRVAADSNLIPEAPTALIVIARSPFQKTIWGI